MNKYQEAINILRNDYTGSINNKALETLEELVEKATPKKVRKETIKLDENDYINGFYFEEGEVTYYYCPNCKERLYAIFDYCYECGQRIGWGEENYQYNEKIVN